MSASLTYQIIKLCSKSDGACRTCVQEQKPPSYILRWLSEKANHTAQNLKADRQTGQPQHSINSKEEGQKETANNQVKESGFAKKVEYEYDYQEDEDNRNEIKDSEYSGRKKRNGNKGQQNFLWNTCSQGADNFIYASDFSKLFTEFEINIRPRIRNRILEFIRHNLEVGRQVKLRYLDLHFQRKVMKKHYLQILTLEISRLQ